MVPDRVDEAAQVAVFPTGEAVLVLEAMDAVDFGANCPHGGARIDTGGPFRDCKMLGLKASTIQAVMAPWTELAVGIERRADRPDLLTQGG